MNPGRRLQRDWRWNKRPLRVRIYRAELEPRCIKITWQRWHPRTGWTVWRAYTGIGTMREVVARYRDYAEGWRGFD